MPSVCFRTDFEYSVPSNSTNILNTTRISSLPFVSFSNNFTMSCGYCFSIIEFFEDFICLKTFQENNMNNSIITRQLSELKLNKQKYWDLSMNYTVPHILTLFHSHHSYQQKRQRTLASSLILSPDNY